MNKMAFFAIIPLAVGCLTAHAENCKFLAGVVKLEPDPACRVTVHYSGPAYIAAPGTCFTSAIKLVNGQSGAGFSGLTKEITLHPLSGGSAQTPAIMNEQNVASLPNEFGLPESRRFFTARSVLSLPGGKIYTADAGVIATSPISASFTSTEQLLITAGEGAYKNSKGAIFLSGNVVQNWAPFYGTICTP